MVLMFSKLFRNVDQIGQIFSNGRSLGKRSWLSEDIDDLSTDDLS